jgi:hypothetical protein
VITSLLSFPARQKASSSGIIATAAVTTESDDPGASKAQLSPLILDESFSQTETVMPVLIVLRAEVGTSMSVLSLKASEPPQRPPSGSQAVSQLGS